MRKKIRSCKGKLCANYNVASLWISESLEEIQVPMPGHAHTHTYT